MRPSSKTSPLLDPLSLSLFLPLSLHSRKLAMQARKTRFPLPYARTLSLVSSASARAAAASSCCSFSAARAAFDGADVDAADADASSTAAWRSAILLSRAFSFFKDFVLIRRDVFQFM